MRWFWVFLPLFFLTACSDDTPQDTVPPSNDGGRVPGQDGNDGNQNSTDDCANGRCDLYDTRSKDGTRLQVLNQDWVGEDGSVIEQPAGAFDTKYGVHCIVGQWGNDDWRCYPEATTLSLYPYYSDSECKNNLIPKDDVLIHSCDERSEFYRTMTSDRAIICNVETTEVTWSHYHVPGGLSAINWESPNMIYRKTDDGCEEYSYPDPSDYYIFTPMEEYRIPNEDFVKMER